MATPTQTEADKSGFNIFGQATTEGVIMFQIGSILFGMGTGAPDSEVTAPMGSIFINVVDGAIYRKEDVAVADSWAAFNN